MSLITSKILTIHAHPVPSITTVTTQLRNAICVIPCANSVSDPLTSSATIATTTIHTSTKSFICAYIVILNSSAMISSASVCHATAPALCATDLQLKNVLHAITIKPTLLIHSPATTVLCVISATIHYKSAFPAIAPASIA